MEREEINRRLECILASPNIAGLVPAGCWGLVKDVLTVLVGNGCDHLAESFLRSLRERTIGAFYVHDRVRLRHAASAYTQGFVGRRELKRALSQLREMERVVAEEQIS